MKKRQEAAIQEQRKKTLKKITDLLLIMQPEKIMAYEKIPGGKFLKIKAEHTDIITKAQITGDFFAYPESCISKIEKIIIGKKIEELKNNDEIEKDVCEFIKKNNCQLIGINGKDIVRVLKKALANL